MYSSLNKHIFTNFDFQIIDIDVSFGRIFVDELIILFTAFERSIRMPQTRMYNMMYNGKTIESNKSSLNTSHDNGM